MALRGQHQPYIWRPCLFQKYIPIVTHVVPLVCNLHYIVRPFLCSFCVNNDLIRISGFDVSQNVPRRLISCSSCLYPSLGDPWMTERMLWGALAILAVLVLFAQLPPKVAEGPLFQKGITYASWRHDVYESLEAARSISLLEQTNAKWVSLVVTWYQQTLDSVIIYRDPYRTPDDRGVIRIIDLIHRLGMKVLLKPTVDVEDESWRGEIRFEREEDWQNWFSSYRYFVNYYAELAARHGVEEFCVGVELAETVDRNRDWCWIIENARTRFKGPLTYAANWSSYWNVPFWDALDYVGIDAYFELAAEGRAETEDLLSAWEPWIEELDAFYEIVKKPVLFTEIGCRSVVGASAQPWEWTIPGQVDVQEQAHYYEAAFRAVWGKPWFYGVYWWTWKPELSEIDEADTGYSPQGKPAEQILTQWYARSMPRGPRGAR